MAQDIPNHGLWDSNVTEVRSTRMAQVVEGDDWHFSLFAKCPDLFRHPSRLDWVTLAISEDKEGFRLGVRKEFFSPLLGNNETSDFTRRFGFKTVTDSKGMATSTNDNYGPVLHDLDIGRSKPKALIKP